ncbi:hypothetical protein L5F35_10025 [Aliarcobacter butzleri]|uniref:phosphoribosyltransferase family protein n=1 Tax=Aliarcobacter butzleri TaxID=28197 RepID=UPI001EDA0B95|nr:phosphoribosyltransferase family protein [Aliarcobacter butzleri]MCG3686549.1 hypothetical protein [Aliarcobacter butzleri]
MGIDLNKRQVIYNSTHQERVDTSIHLNSNWQRKNTVLTATLLKRRRTKDNIDGNPLIYALKNINGYTIDKKNLFPIIKNALKNLDTALNQKNYDLIVCIPSSGLIVNKLSLRVQRRLPLTKISNYVLKKCINKDIIKSIDLSTIKNKQHNHDVKEVLKKLKSNQGSQFVLKEIKSNVRKYFNPIKISNPYLLRDSQNILLLDDALSSGTTLYFAQKLIKDINPNINIEAICFLSSLH